MAIMKKVQTRELYMGKLSYGADLLQELTDICQKEQIQLGRVWAIGAVQRVRLAYYDQKIHEYQFFVIDQPLEITNLTGNVSLKDGAPFVHAHITLADKQGRTYGGHLAPGTEVFACEVILEIFDGPAFERALDQQTSLSLWALTE
jgi:predicted DNA-binding protein with PD1-like motif